MIEGQRTNNIGPAGEGDDSDPIVRPAFDELSCYLANRIDPRRGIAADREILGQHRARNVEHDHNVDTARFDFGQALAELRTGERENENGEREIKQPMHDAARARSAPLAECPQARGRRKDQRGCCAALSAQPREQRHEEQKQ